MIGVGFFNLLFACAIDRNKIFLLLQIGCKNLNYDPLIEAIGKVKFGKY